MFKMTDTYNEVMNSGLEDKIKMLMGNMLFSDQCVTSLLPEEVYDKTLQEIYDTIKTPWMRPFPADELMVAANIANEVFAQKKWEVRALWNEQGEPVFDNSKECACLFTPKMEDEGDRPALLLVPGGGYMTIAMIGEGFNMAKKALECGFRPYILRYRILPNRFPAGHKDLALAIMHIRANAKKDHVLVDDLTIAGFSAGGHLCASMTSHVDEIRNLVLEDLKTDARLECYSKQKVMPEKMILGYAVTSLDKKYCEGLPGICAPKERQYYSPLEHLHADMPKTYSWACKDDTLVPCCNSEDMNEKLNALGVESMCHIFPSGGHGVAVGYGTSAEGWFEEMLDFMNK